MADNNLPPPMTPPDCELQDFKFMPLDVVRLRSSEQNSDVTPEANWAALQLWAAAWHEVPAASIPDNDQWQAKAAGYVARGAIDEHWEGVRTGALRKFVKCSDGRLYHPVVAEKALEAWASKLEQRWRSECGRIKKHNQRHELKGSAAVSVPSYEEWVAAGRPQGHPLPVPEDRPPVSSGRPPGQRVQGTVKGQGQGQGQGLPLNSNTVPKSPAAAPATELPGVEPVPAKPPKPPAKAKPGDSPELQAACFATWAAYSKTYGLTYGTPPVRNAKANSLIKQFVLRIGHAEAPHVAAFFLSHQNPLYLRALHPLDLLVKDAEGLRTQWKTGRTASARDTGETAYQRSQREQVEKLTGGLASRKVSTHPPPAGDVIDVSPSTTPKLN